MLSSHVDVNEVMPEFLRYSGTTHVRLRAHYYPSRFDLAEFGRDFLHTDHATVVRYDYYVSLMGFCPYHQTCSDVGSHGS